MCTTPSYWRGQEVPSGMERPTAYRCGQRRGQYSTFSSISQQKSPPRCWRTETGNGVQKVCLDPLRPYFKIE